MVKKKTDGQTKKIKMEKVRQKKEKNYEEKKNNKNETKPNDNNKQRLQQLKKELETVLLLNVLYTQPIQHYTILEILVTLEVNTHAFYSLNCFITPNSHTITRG